MYPTEACVLQVNDALFCHPKEARITHGIFPGLLLASGMTCLSQFEHPFKKKKTSKEIFFLPAPGQLILTLTYPIKKKKKT